MQLLYVSLVVLYTWPSVGPSYLLSISYSCILTEICSILVAIVSQEAGMVELKQNFREISALFQVPKSKCRITIIYFK